jgi:hypothetical protein
MRQKDDCIVNLQLGDIGHTRMIKKTHFSKKTTPYKTKSEQKYDANQS